MDILIIYASFHHKNTEKIAKEIGEILKARVVNFLEVKKEEIEKADFVGFGSGVYFSKFHKGLIKLVKKLPEMEEKKTFIFSTSGMRKNIFLNRSHSHFKKELENKNFKIVGEFNCLGHDSYAFLKYFGGINKGRPNEKDIENASNFARSILKSIEEE